ncbi:maestro heat-like repeat-containing protein family member 1 [Numida meleagris]|uniref:maestro heat-like repeat-containing protein family member 1 n=1 Tax=Numida meleagris TaxID=8996 RepID=UPI000B3E235E|nr:maestro heat-like repeat-containing protein family member 1 [Numida meleagris]XP_021239603.1 maestro heat-like repeat-containing protein family member 1 [Numida meleagris]
MGRAHRGAMHPIPPFSLCRPAACSFPDRVLTFLLPKLESSSERTRVGTLLIMRQIINSAPSQMEIKKPFILSSMKLPLQDSNNKVRRAVVQVISAMAHHGYLEQPGGEAMLEFLVRQCALPSDAPQKPLPDADSSTSDSVRSISVNTLLLLSTTVDRMNNVSVCRCPVTRCSAGTSPPPSLPLSPSRPLSAGLRGGSVSWNH